MKNLILSFAFLSLFATSAHSQIYIQTPLEGLTSSSVQDFRIIGKNDMVFVKPDLSNIPARFKPLVGAIGKMSSGCTVSHIGNGLVITAGHCFWQTFFEPKRLINQNCSEETIQWRKLDGDSKEAPESKCEKIYAMQDDDQGNIDFAIFQVSNPPVAKLDLDFSEANLLSRKITIFSYPDDRDLTWSKYCTVMPPGSDPEYQKGLSHKCDTEAGSSGAPILDAKTGKVIGLHISGDGVETDPNVAPAVQNYGYFLYNNPIKDLLKNIVSH